MPCVSLTGVNWHCRSTSIRRGSRISSPCTTNIPLKTSVGFVSLFPQFIIWFLSVPRVVVSMPLKKAGAPRFLSVTLWIVNTHRPIIVPDSQMRNFMAGSANYDESLLYFEPSEVEHPQEVPVCVSPGGFFEGVEGEFVRVTMTVVS